MTKNADVLPTLVWLNEGLENGKVLSISHLHSEVFNAVRSSYVILLKKPANFYINKATKSTPI